MKDITREKLLTEITTKRYNAMGQNGVDDLFNIYCAYEFHCVEDLHKGVRDFTSFIIENQEKLNYENNMERANFFSYVLSLQENFSNLTNPSLIYYRQNQVEYAEIVSRLADKHKGAHVVDVGPGEIPYSSFHIAQKLDKEISAIDYFMLSKDSMKILKVNAYNEHINEDTDMSPFGLAVSKRPCRGTAILTQKCHENNIPYLIELCVCNAPKGSVRSWFEELQKIDKNIKFSRNEKYVYNLKASEKAVNNILEMSI